MLAHELETIDGVIMVGKDPDYMITAVIISRDQTVAIAVQVDEIPEKEIAVALLRESTRDQIKSVAAVLGSLTRFADFDIKLGSPSALPALCTEIVTRINTMAFADERRFPRGSRNPDTVFKNFIFRMGGHVTE